MSTQTDPFVADLVERGIPVLAQSAYWKVGSNARRGGGPRFYIRRPDAARIEFSNVAPPRALLEELGLILDEGVGGGAVSGGVSLEALPPEGRWAAVWAVIEWWASARPAALGRGRGPTSRAPVGYQSPAQSSASPATRPSFTLNDD